MATRHRETCLESELHGLLGVTVYLYTSRIFYTPQSWFIARFVVSGHVLPIKFTQKILISSTGGEVICCLWKGKLVLVSIQYMKTGYMNGSPYITNTCSPRFSHFQAKAALRGIKVILLNMDQLLVYFK